MDQTIDINSTFLYCSDTLIGTHKIGPDNRYKRDITDDDLERISDILGVNSLSRLNPFVSKLSNIYVSYINCIDCVNKICS